MKQNDSIISSFKNAFSGLLIVIRLERNAKLHLVATILIILIASFLQLTITDWLFLVLAIFLVWLTEAINTSFENLCDLVEPNIDPIVKNIKDVSAAAVLLAALFSVIVGILILGPPILEKLSLQFH